MGKLVLKARHKLICGDATDKAVLDKLMDGEQADLCVTDPPYNVAVNDESEESLKKRNRRSDGLKIENDKMSEDDFIIFLDKVFTGYFSILKDGASIYVFYADSMTVPFMTTFVNAGFHFAQNVIWNKQQFVMTRKDYHYKHEPILYGWKKGVAHNWYSDRTQTSVWNFNRPFRSELHPTTKPIDILEYAINNSSKNDELVVDLFGGSGSTLIACEKNRRRYVGTELSEHYSDVIVNRFKGFCGKTVLRLTNDKIEVC